LYIKLLGRETTTNVENVKEKAKAVATENKQLGRS
jgi:hypothetical protein